MDALSGGEDASEILRRDLLLKTDHRVGRGGGRGCFDFLAAKQKGHASGPVYKQPQDETLHIAQPAHKPITCHP